MDLVVENIGQLITCAGGGLGLVEDAAVAVRGGKVVYAGPQRGLPAGLPGDRIDAARGLVSPGLCDPHAHLVFAGSRAHEFDLRAQGKTYQEIQAAGGGILATVNATRAATNIELLAGTLERLDRFLAQGVTCVEGKTGYDLTIDGELRLLGVLAEARHRHAIDISPTFLAHVPPPDGDRAAFVKAFCAALPDAKRRGAEAVDVYCDQGAFTIFEARQILEAGQKAGLLLRAHAEQFTFTGIAQVAASLGARSVEHLEQLSVDAPEALAKAGTVCNLLPGAALTLKLPWPDARKLYAAGCRVALGTDCNPGSSLTESLPLMMSLACMQMHMSCEQAWRAVTVEAAYALNRADAGHLEPGSRGDVVLWSVADHREVPQHFGVPLVRTVVRAGRIVWDATSSKQPTTA